MTELTTERLILRAAREEDLAPLFSIFSNAQAMRYWDSPPHRSPKDTGPTHRSLMRAGKRKYFVWEHAGAVIGAGGIHSKAELGFILHPDYWGQGFAREGATAALAHFWQNHRADRVVACADPRNRASVGLLTRLGFRVTGFKANDMCVAGAWSDSVFLVLDRPG